MQTIGIIGARGLIGSRVLKLMAKCKVKLVPLGRKIGAIEVSELGKAYPIYSVDTFDFTTLDGAMVCVENGKFYREKMAHGWVIDCSKDFYQDDSVPKVVPEIYHGGLRSVISSPNCVSISIALVLYWVKLVANIKQVWGSSYQSISGEGSQALSLYKNNKGIYDKLIPKIGRIEDGVSQEERDITICVQKILGIELPISILAVRVPIALGHGVHLRIECSDSINLQALLDKLKDCPYIQYEKGVLSNKVVKDSPKVFVSRIRALGNVLDMWLVSDNLYRGAAWNMYKTAVEMFGIREKVGEQV